ncbi:LytR/AlgR family response regulator transcription factor [Bifidobacterium eulemuris]|uniref:DNA-binding response regulator n=1 Tax=Bifidobacterium eulemuris TaxID=1765219 RepID=A0A261G2Q1_9BIFI|nr:LytTR family DNA-binding domain-containing protein [Bifidobacterium eulemuris]OZG65276.1 DNA-binding response regulator [Bifidobacterium eulemuris]QOL32309.1 response regulator transcription factor [Bifidobacterium eulemuris]
MVTIAIVDDEAADAAQTTELVDRYYERDSSRYAITRYADGESFLNQYSAQFDVIFLDVDMPGMDGMEVATRLRELDAHVVLVFTTKVVRYAATGYDVDAIGYLLKPLKYFPFALKMRKIEELVAQRRNVTVTLSIEGETHFLSSHDIQYVEVMRHEVTYHTADGAWKVWSSLKEATESLAEANFAPCNRYCLVNLEWVKAVVGDEVIVGGNRLPISRAKKKPLMQALADYYGGRG